MVKLSKHPICRDRFKKNCNVLKPLEKHQTIIERTWVQSSENMLGQSPIRTFQMHVILKLSLNPQQWSPHHELKLHEQGITTQNPEINQPILRRKILALTITQINLCHWSRKFTRLRTWEDLNSHSLTSLLHQQEILQTSLMFNGELQRIRLERKL